MRGSPIAFWVLAAACTNAPATDPTAEYPTPLDPGDGVEGVEGPLMPLPDAVDLDPEKVALGERLFTDARISGDGKVACVSCHAFDKGGSNGRAFTDVPGRAPMDVNVPSVFNLAFDFRFAWSGKFREVGEQIDVAMTSPKAMAGTWTKAAAALRADADLRGVFAAMYPEGISEGSVRDVIVNYALSLVTPGSRFDRFLSGQDTLAPDARRGYEMFRDYGCVSCHQGINVGGNMYQRFGVMGDYFADRGEVKKADFGLFNATGDERDKFVFRVPSLRNVALTAPYFHDASVPTLEGAVQTMARYQLGRVVSDAEATDIAAFLRTLTGTLGGKPL